MMICTRSSHFSRNKVLRCLIGGTNGLTLWLKSSGHCTLVLTGYLHARGLSVNQLVHVTGAGDFQLHKIELLKVPCTLNVQKGMDPMDSEEINVQVVRCLTPDPMKQEPLTIENIPDLLAGEQTWPTEA